MSYVLNSYLLTYLVTTTTLFNSHFQVNPGQPVPPQVRLFHLFQVTINWKNISCVANASKIPSDQIYLARICTFSRTNVRFIFTKKEQAVDWLTEFKIKTLTSDFKTKTLTPRSVVSWSWGQEHNFEPRFWRPRQNFWPITRNQQQDLLKLDSSALETWELVLKMTRLLVLKESLF